MSLSARFRRSRDEEGIGLVEVIVSIGVSAMVLLAVLATSVFAVRASADARKNQQAADYLNSAVEAVRGLSYASVSMLTSDLGTDSNIVTVGGVKKYDPGSGLEPIDATTSGLVTPHIADADQGKNATNGSYKVYRYVTVPSTATYNAQGLPSVRRLTVVVTWKVRGSTHTRKTSTLVTNTRRGLPLPNFTYTYRGPATMSGGVATFTKAPGNVVDYGMVLTNLGARDSWTITSSTTGWTYYLDTDADGLWDGALTEPMVSPANTGLIEPGSGAVYLVAERTIALTESGTTTTVFTATSDSQPSYPSRSFTTRLTVNASATPSPTPSATATVSPTPSPTATSATGTCTPGTNTTVASPAAVQTSTGGNGVGSSYTPTTVLPYNGTGTLDKDTTTIAQNTAGTDPTGLHASICNYSTDVQTSQAGRYLGTTGYAEWVFQPGSIAQDEYRGTAYLNLYFQCIGTTAPTFTVALGTYTSASAYSGQTSDTGSSACPASGFKNVSIPISVGNSGFSVPTSGKLSIRVSSNQAVRLLYGVSAAQTSLSLAMK